MTKDFDAKDDSELLVLLKERVRTAHVRDEKLDAKLDAILGSLHAMDTKSQLTEHRLNALHTDHHETKSRLDAVEADKRGVFAHVASILSQIALWTAK